MESHMKLIHEATGHEVKPGDTVVTRKGVTVTLMDYDGSGNRVYCDDNGTRKGWFPEVIGCRFVKTN